MFKTVTRLLFLIFKDPESVHRLAIIVLTIVGFPGIRTIAQLCMRVKKGSLSQEVFGIRFENPIGLAGGFDKNGYAISGLNAFGFGFIEIGTVTQHAQEGNPRPRIFRFPKDLALINRMGFNNDGADSLAFRLKTRVTGSVPIGISIGKSKITELSRAADDYLYSYKLLYPYGDYFVINVSSPNTAGLRKLQDKDFLTDIVSKLNAFRDREKKRKPLLVKIAPDLTFEAIDEVLEVCNELKLDGIIATNTTVHRDGLSTMSEETGGMSGRPLRDKSTEIIRYIRRKNRTLPIIGVGGIMSAKDAYEKILAGANLVQVYTGFTYEGPFFPRRLVVGVDALLKNDGYNTLGEAIGVNAS